MRTYLRVGAIIFHNGKLVTTKMQKKGNSYYVLPGGGVEENETIIEAIKREVKEETDLDVKKFRLVYVRELNLKIDGGGRGVEFYFIVEEYDGVPKKGFDPEKKESSLESVELLSVEETNKVSFHPEQLINFLKSDYESNFKEFRHLGLFDYP